MSLFKLVPDNETSADELISNATPTSTVFKAVPAGNSGIINIVESMQIATNDIIPGSYLANKIPTCILKEYELIANSSVSQLLYYLRSIGTTANGSVSDLLNQAATTLGNVGSGAEKLLSGSVGGYIKDFVGDNTKEILDKATQPLQEILKNNEQFSGSMTPYQNLYLRKATNFKYILPFYTDKKKDITNAFTDSQTGLLAGNLFAKYVTGGAKLAYETVAKNLLFATPGAYIEQPKFFDAGTNGESYEIKFDLINTINSDRVQTHFDLLFLLAYQNLPFRKDIARVTLPKIYTFIIPGEIYLPYAYISSLKIDFVGNRRKMKIIHPKFIASDAGTLLDCIVPEVYSVSMTVTGLTTPAANYMIADELFKITSTSVDAAPIVTGSTLPGAVPFRPVDVPLVPLNTQIARLNNNITGIINNATGNTASFQSPPLGPVGIRPPPPQTTPLDLRRPTPPTRTVVPTVRDNISLVNLNNATFINGLTTPQTNAPRFNIQPVIIP